MLIFFRIIEYFAETEAFWPFIWNSIVNYLGFYKFIDKLNYRILI
jgi:hypothetical protein